jgi:hypothetical protein
MMTKSKALDHKHFQAFYLWEFSDLFSELVQQRRQLVQSMVAKSLEAALCALLWSLTFSTLSPVHSHLGFPLTHLGSLSQKHATTTLVCPTLRCRRGLKEGIHDSGVQALCDQWSTGSVIGSL